MKNIQSIKAHRVLQGVRGVRCRGEISVPPFSLPL